MFKSLGLRGYVLPKHAPIIVVDTVTLMDYLWLNVERVQWTEISRNVERVVNTYFS